VACSRWSGAATCARLFLGAIGLVLLVQLGLLATVGHPSLPVLAGLLFLFFCGFNVLEATQPSLASRVAPPHARAPRWACTTRCSRWDFLPAARRRLAGEERRADGAVHRLCGADAGLAGRGLAHEGAVFAAYGRRHVGGRGRRRHNHF
jgi:hypothetical protein